MLELIECVDLLVFVGLWSCRGGIKWCLLRNLILLALAVILLGI